jgi:RHS repeat-associated protein
MVGKQQEPLLVPVGTQLTGKERDAETGLDYFGARYYSGAQGRFTSPDEFTGGIVDPFTGRQVGQPGPLPYADITDPQTLNKYAYVRNNPLRYVDPDGHCIWDLCVGEGAAVYAAGAATVTAAAYLMTPQGKQSAAAAISLAGTALDSAANALSNLVFNEKADPSKANPPSAPTPGESGKTKENTNPYAGPVSSPVTVVDDKGNAIPVKTGEQVQGSKDGRFTQVKDANGKPTGTRIDGGHKPTTHPDPRAQKPHAHVPGKTNPDGTPWLPINQ